MLDSEQYDKKLQKQEDIYQRISLLGSGSFGKAFLVKQIKTEQLFVIKQINIADLSQQQQENARREAKILQILNHPNIIKFKQVYTTSKMKLNIVMQYANGGDIATKIQDAKKNKQYLQESQILSWFTQICLGIKHLHDRKILHRDLKGQNIFLTDDNCVKIGDLGVARVLEHTVAKARTMVGSPYYLSPQIIQNRPYSFKSDIWSLGALLYEMCALVPPFTANNLEFLALKIVKGSYANIPQQYSGQLKSLIRSMLTTNPIARPNIVQILSSPIIQRRIKTLLSESQNIQQFSHTILHKFNPLKNQVEDKLRPPPNLMEIQQQQLYENLSAIVTNGQTKISSQPQLQNQKQTKSKTPYSYGKNAPPIKKKPISINMKKQVNKEKVISDLVQIMQIKATPLQPHVIPQKIPKPISITSPIVNMAKKRPQSSKVAYQSQKISQKNIYVNKNATNVNFNNKKSIDCTNFNSNKNQIKNQENRSSNLNLQIQINKKQDKSSRQVNEKIIKNKEQLKNELVAHHQNKIQQKKKQKKVVKPKRNNLKADNKNNIKTKQTKLQLVSQQMKQKQRTEKQKQKNSKVNKKSVKNQKVTQKKIKLDKEKTNQQNKNQEEKQIIQQQKCNDASDEKYEQQFQTYEQKQQQLEEQVSGSELSFELSNSSHPQYKEQNVQNNDNYKKMLSQLQLIHRAVEQANGMVDNLPLMGSGIPQLLELQLSADGHTNVNVRQDDSDLQSQLCKTNMQHLSKTESQLNLTCLGDQSELENLRIALQEIFGIHNIINAYQFLSQVIQKSGLDFNEEQTIRSLLREYKQIDECLLRKYFRLIVTVITLENQLQK